MRGRSCNGETRDVMTPSRLGFVFQRAVQSVWDSHLGRARDGIRSHRNPWKLGKGPHHHFRKVRERGSGSLWVGGRLALLGDTKRVLRVRGTKWLRYRLYLDILTTAQQPEGDAIYLCSHTRKVKFRARESSV